MRVVYDIDLDLAVAGIAGRMRSAGSASKARWRAVEMIREENLLASLACYRRLRVREVRDGRLFFARDLALHCPALAAVSAPLEGVTAVACSLGEALEKRVFALCAENKLAAGLALMNWGTSY